MTQSECANQMPAATKETCAASEPNQPVESKKTNLGEKLEGGFVLFELLVLVAEIFADL